MIDLPESTIVNRIVSKEKFYGKTTMSTILRKQFTDEIEKIIWLNKISPETLNITAGEYEELQIFEIILKGKDINIAVLRHIDTCILYPILFIVTKEDSKKAVVAYKEITLQNQNIMKVDSYFETPWQKDLELELKGRSVDKIYENYLYQIAPELRSDKYDKMKNAVGANETSKKLQLQIDALNKKIRNELSISKKQEYAKQRFVLEQKLGEL